jgi:hypothetical protein
MQTTQLAHGKITNADTLTIELIEPPDMPPTILLRWPQKSSITTPTRTAMWPQRPCRCWRRRSSN